MVGGVLRQLIECPFLSTIPAGLFSNLKSAGAEDVDIVVGSIDIHDVEAGFSAKRVLDGMIAPAAN